MAPDRLLLTKLYLPTARSQLVPRPRLVSKLACGLQGPLTLVCAPAGYGKTTLMSEWHGSALGGAVPTAWVSLDVDDNDAAAFLGYIAAALNGIGLLTEGCFAKLSRSIRAREPYLTVSLLINELAQCPQDFVLALEDYHVISNPKVHAIVSSLLDHQPRSMHIVLLTRTEPPIGIALLRARGKLTEIGASDLRFSVEEIGSLLETMASPNLTVGDASALEKRTEGWAVALQLALVAAQRQSERTLDWLAGDSPLLLDYLLSEVFSCQPPEIQEFLLVTSVPDRFCASLCDSLRAADVRGDGGALCQSNSSVLLDSLEHANLFLVPLDAHRHWYRYHHLFRDFLHSCLLKLHPNKVSSVHRLASDWFHCQAWDAEAIQHAVLTADWDYVAGLVEDTSLPVMMSGDFRTVQEGSAVLPDQVADAHPAACMFRALTTVVSCREENRSIVQENVWRAMQSSSADEYLNDRRQLQGRAALAESFLGMIPSRSVNPVVELGLAQKAYSLMPDSDPIRGSALLQIAYAHMALSDLAAASASLKDAKRLASVRSNHYCLADASFYEVRLAAESGHLTHAARICRQAQAHFSSLFLPGDFKSRLPAVGSLEIALGCILLEQDDLAEAERHLLEGLELIAACANAHYVVVGYSALFWLYQSQGHHMKALSCLDRLEERWPDVMFYTEALRILHLLRLTPDASDVLAAVSAWCETLSPRIGNELHLPGTGPLGAAWVYYRAYLVWARAMTAIGRPDEALDYICAQLEAASQHGLKERVITLSVEQALALRALGRNKLAVEAMSRALVSGQGEGYVRVFDQGLPTAELLTKISRSCGPLASFAGSLVTRFAQRLDSDFDEPCSGSRGSSEVLTKREKALLQLVSNGLSNAEIARELYIEIGTVKQHMSHIMRKLGVASRTAAVARAKANGFL